MKTARNGLAVRAFCSTANLGAGFDTFGLALDRYSDVVTARITQSRKLRIIVRGRDARNLPREPARNSAGPPAMAIISRARFKKGLLITIDKNVPQGLGLGSSGATAAASAKALNQLMTLDLSNDELVQVASLGERAVSGTAHADNVGASLLGGFVVVYGDPLKAISIKPPSNLRVVVATPQLSLQRNKTKKARALVPSKTKTRQAVLNIGRASAIATGFAERNIPLIGTGMEDEIAEPYRRNLIPGYSEVRRLALEAGAVGVSISGAGPSMVALVDGSRREPKMIAHAMTRGFTRASVRSTCFVARPAPGAKVIQAN